MARVFLSYVRDDIAVAERLVKVFREYGIDVWFDRDQLRPGHRWRNEIRAESPKEISLLLLLEAYSERTRTYRRRAHVGDRRAAPTPD